MVPSKRTLIRIGLIVSLAVGTFERMRAWFAFLSFQFGQVDFGVCLATPAEFSVVFGFVRTIVFDALGTLDPA